MNHPIKMKRIIIFLGLILPFVFTLGACGDCERQEGSTIVPFSNPPPETISFSSYQYKLERPMARIGAFVLKNNLYVVTYTDAASIYKVGVSGLEKVIDGRDFGFGKRGAFNVEVVGDKAYIIGGAIVPHQTDFKKFSSCGKLWSNIPCPGGEQWRTKYMWSI